jgi:hypothetical protein
VYVRFGEQQTQCYPVGAHTKGILRMARMYPSALPAHVLTDNRLRAERNVYNALQNQLGNDWTVFHSVAWIAPRRLGETPNDGETDFLILHPQKGVLLIEVKGGIIACDGETQRWTSTGSGGTLHAIDDPFHQATKFKYGLRNKFRSLPQWRREWVDFGHAVIFPDCVLSAGLRLPPNAPPEILIDASGMNALLPRLNAIFSYWDASGERLTKGGQLTETLIGLLAPTTTLPNPLWIQAQQVQAELLTLTEEQFRLLDTLKRNPRVAVAGAAGSGKTLMAVEKAQRLAREGFRTLLACHSTLLARHLQKICPEITGEAGFVGTFHDWCAAVAGEAAVALPRTAADEPNWDAYPDTLITALAARPDLKVDALLLDEAQDISDDWWLALMESLRDRADAVTYVFYDNNQNVYPGTPLTPGLDFMSIDLVENLRNTHCIHKATRPFYHSEINVQAQGPFGRTVEKIAYSDATEMGPKLTRILTDLLVT